VTERVDNLQKNDFGEISYEPLTFGTAALLTAKNKSKA
jgi:hypothetical protein